MHFSVSQVKIELLNLKDRKRSPMEMVNLRLGLFVVIFVVIAFLGTLAAIRMGVESNMARILMVQLLLSSIPFIIFPFVIVLRTPSITGYIKSKLFSNICVTFNIL